MKRLVAGLCGLLLCNICVAESLAGPASLPQRWVTAGGALSEWVVQLGGEAKLVGVDSTSQQPPSLQKLAGVGYQRQLAAEGILALRPDLLLGTEEMGPPVILAQLAAAGVRVEVLSAQPNLPALQANVQRIGQLLGVPQLAAQQFSDYQQQLSRQQLWVAAAQADTQAPEVLLLLGHAGAAPMVAGLETAGDWLIKQAGGRNLAAHSGYKVLSSEALLALNPQVLIIADRSLSGEAARQALLVQNPALAATRAVSDRRVWMLDPSLLVGGLGPRLPAGLAALSAALYPAAQPLTAQGYQ
jgi:iron complex transport system substrate-binding protein